jgi:NitT/TauT family transport system substrate-binding protein
VQDFTEKVFYEDAKVSLENCTEAMLFAGKLIKEVKKRWNKMKRIILMLLISSLLVVSCAPAEETPKTSGEVMKVAKNYWPGQYWIEIAYSKGWFEEAGLSVELVDTNPDYFQGIQDTVDGKIDTNQLVLFDLMDFNAQGANFVSVINSDISSGADGMVAENNILNVFDLKDKTVGVQKGTFTEFILQIMLEKNGMSIDDVIPIEVESDTPNPFIDGTVNALITWEPHLSEASEKREGRILFDSSDIPGLIPDVHVFTRKFIDERPEDVQAYVNVWHRTTKFIKENPKEAYRMIADIYGFSIDEVESLAENGKILDFRENKIAFSYAAGFESLHGTARQINDFMIEKGITDKKLDSLDFIDARFIRNVE